MKGDREWDTSNVKGIRRGTIGGWWPLFYLWLLSFLGRRFWLKGVEMPVIIVQPPGGSLWFSEIIFLSLTPFNFFLHFCITLPHHHFLIRIFPHLTSYFSTGSALLSFLSNHEASSKKQWIPQIPEEKQKQSKTTLWTKSYRNYILCQYQTLMPKKSVLDYFPLY